MSNAVQFQLRYEILVLTLCLYFQSIERYQINKENGRKKSDFITFCI